MIIQTKKKIKISINAHGFIQIRARAYGIQ